MTDTFEFSLWTAFGFLGSLLFFGRLLVQWILSERAGKPVIPALYWYLSVAAALILTIYAGVRKEPVFLLNYLVPLAIYVRQLVLHLRSAKTASAVAHPAGGGVCPCCGRPEGEANGSTLAGETPAG